MIDVIALVDALVAHASADIALGGTGILGPVLTAYGQSIDTSADTNDSGELVGLKYMERLDPPDGVCIQFTPKWYQEDDAVPGPQIRVDLDVEIKVTLKDYPGNTLSGKVGTQGRFLTALSAALERLFDPTSIGAVDDGWPITASPSYVLLKPRCRTLDPVAEGQIQGQAGLVAELDFTGFTFFSPP